jgi:hypothetical protein
LALISGMVQAQFSSKSDCEKDNLRGKVKTVRDDSYKVIIQSGKIFPDLTTSIYPKKQVYSKKGNLIEIFHYTRGDTLMHRNVIHYDQKGKPVTEDNYDSDNNWENQGTYVYNDQELLVKTICCNDSANGVVATHYYKYNEAGNKIEDDYYFSNGYHVFRIEYLYDKNNLLIEENAYDPDSSLSTRHLYKYNEKGLKSEMIIEQPKRNMKDTYRFNYDDQGNVISKSTFNWEKATGTYYYIYKYDLKKNWVQQTIFLENIPLAIAIRKIRYY